MDTITNGGKTIGDGSTRGSYYPLDGRRETHPAWMAGNIKRFDPFQDTVPCWMPPNIDIRIGEQWITEHRV